MSAGVSESKTKDALAETRLDADRAWSGGLQAGRSPPVSPLKPRPRVCVSQGLALCLAPEAMDPQVSTVKTEVTENTTHPLSNETAPSVSTER